MFIGLISCVFSHRKDSNIFTVGRHPARLTDSVEAGNAVTIALGAKQQINTAPLLYFFISMALWKVLFISIAEVFCFPTFIQRATLRAR